MRTCFETLQIGKSSYLHKTAQATDCQKPHESATKRRKNLVSLLTERMPEVPGCHLRESFRTSIVFDVVVVEIRPARLVKHATIILVTV